MISQILDGFSFHAQWNGGVIFFSLILIVLYMFLLPTPKDHKKYKSIAFAGSMLLILFAVGSPLNLLGRLLFRAHIIQIVIVLFIAAPLIVIGIKTNLLEKMLKNKVIKKVYRFLTHPLFAIVLFYSLFIGYHVPVVFDWIRTGYFTNYFFLVGLIVAAVLLWWPIIGPIREYDTLTFKQKLIYIVVNIVLFVPLTLFLWLANGELYTVYSDTSQMLAALALCMPIGEEVPPDLLETLLPYPPISEQRNGAIILFISQALIFGISTLWLFMKKGRK
ncbi:cytochrome c oxidase assembly protein [Bacillus timonensis]|uniref:cytochrome c oxidase assembly protein n=1 Tax=Bacillus timonensis TaxID=1033734 RepID=UPI0002880887|nr:cytochrome c oxidase assembly protein [Bacillus timonensis]